MDVLLLQFCAVAKEKMEHAIVLRMADHFHVQLCNPSKNLSFTWQKDPSVWRSKEA
jgi:hypothetical protein